MSQLTHTSTMYREMEEDLCDPTANLGFAEYDTATALGNPIIDLESGHDMAIFALGDPDLVPDAASLTLAQGPAIGQCNSGALLPASFHHASGSASFSPPVQADFTAATNVGLGLTAGPHLAAIPIGHGQARHRPCRNINSRPTCECGMQFSRRSSLDRHRQSGARSMNPARNGNVPGHLCEYCDGTWSTARRDHLLQHYRVYHRFFPRAMENHRVRQVNMNTVATAQGQTVGPAHGTGNADWEVYGWGWEDEVM